MIIKTSFTNLNSIIEDFLSKEVEPEFESERIELEHYRTREILDQIIGNDLTKHFLMGSYIRQILIKRMSPDDKYDVDIMLIFDKTRYGGKDLSELQNVTYNACLKVRDEINKQEGEKIIAEVRTQKTSVGLIYSDNFRIDLVPGVAIANEEKYKIYDSRSSKPVITDPEEHNFVLTKANKSSRKLVPLIKLIKRWKREKCKDIFKSFHLSSLAVELFSDKKINTYLEGLKDFFEYAYDKTVNSESVIDPANSSNDISSYLDDENIRKEASVHLKNALAECQNALNKLEESPEEAVTYLGNLYNYFIGYINSEKTLFVLGDTSHQIQPRWPVNLIHNDKLKVEARCFWGKQSNKGFWIDQGALKSHKHTLKAEVHHIKYIAHVSLPTLFEVYWQIVNTGEQATSILGGKRGDKFEYCNGGSEPYVRWEETRYTGKHYAECFVIQNGVCVARKRFYINVLNDTYKRNDIFKFLHRR